MKRFEAILKRETGLDATSVGPSFLHRAVNTRMRAVGLSTLDDYHLLLLTNDVERQSLIEQAVVPETWFFRDRGPFQMLARMIVDEWLPTHPTGQVRLLSLPCSTGEEPYSMVMALKDARVPEDRFTIDAVDISENALKYARAGTYRNYSFRGKELSFRRRHFKPSGEAWVIDAYLRRKVTFLRGNLLDEKFIHRLGLYDFIFCRNLLIYFDDAGRARATHHLHRLLKKTGLCYFSPVEVPLVLGSGFAQAGLSMTFACRKELLPPPVRIASQVIPRKPANGSRPLSRQSPPSRQGASNTGTGARDELQASRRLAEMGDWKAALRQCQRYLDRNILCADGHYLLGRLFDMLGDESKAVEAYRRVLFLQPDHYESMVRLAALARDQGDLSRARVLDRRAERFRPSSTQANA